MSKQIKDLTLDDLFSGLDAARVQKAATEGRRLKKCETLSKEAQREAMIADAAKKHLETQKKISPWIPEANVYCQVQVTCTQCHSSFKYPAAESLLIRFRHRRNGGTWETANHPSQMNPHLPKEIQTVQRKTHCCSFCFQWEETAQHYFTQQAQQAQEQNDV